MSEQAKVILGAIIVVSFVVWLLFDIRAKDIASSPATPDAIKKAILKCPAVSEYINKQTKPVTNEELEQAINSIQFVEWKAKKLNEQKNALTS